MNNYPSSEQIINGRSPPIKKELKILTKWKSDNYKNWLNKSDITKEKALKNLLLTINKVKKGKKLKIIFDKKDQSCYNGTEVILCNYSIITALHELAHHLYGESELIACRYSVWLFKKVFPGSFNKLEFKGHLLIKKK